MRGRGRDVQAWGDVCDGKEGRLAPCEDHVRQKTVGCTESGCHRFKIVPNEFEPGITHYRLHCTHCREWTSVNPSDGASCSRCGLACPSAMAAAKHHTKLPGVDGLIVEGEIRDPDAIDDIKDQALRDLFLKDS